MYQFSKDIKFIEIGLGETKLELSIEPAKIMDQVNRSYNEILRLQDEINKSDKNDITEVYEKFGMGVLQLISIVFGDKAEEYIRYYEGNYTSLLMNLIPFIDKVIFPMLEESKTEQQKIISDQYKNLKKYKK